MQLSNRITRCTCSARNKGYARKGKTPRLTRGSKDATRLTINPPTARLKLRSGNCNKPREGGNMGLNDINSLAHSKWNCKYHIVFAPKYRIQVFYGEKAVAIGKILMQLCEWKGVKIIEAELCRDHVHMLVEIPPKIAVSSINLMKTDWENS